MHVIHSAYLTVDEQLLERRISRFIESRQVILSDEVQEKKKNSTYEL